jgi:hypothetical protein
MHGANTRTAQPWQTCLSKRASKVPGRPPQRSHDGLQHGGIQAVLRRHAGNGGKSHRLRHQDQRTGQARNGISAQRVAAHQGPQRKKGNRRSQVWFVMGWAAAGSAKRLGLSSRLALSVLFWPGQPGPKPGHGLPTSMQKENPGRDFS